MEECECVRLGGWHREEIIKQTRKEVIEKIKKEILEEVNADQTLNWLIVEDILMKQLEE